jgi:hypothetical protein
MSQQQEVERDPTKPEKNARKWNDLEIIKDNPLNCILKGE